MRIVYTLIAVLSLTTFLGCNSVDDDRIPYAPVSVSFVTIGEWQVYGVTAALDYRRFIKEQKIPSGFPYTDISRTGFGGVLLVCDYEGNPHAFDLACPVECSQQTRIFVNEDLVGECPVCHSTYDVFRLGHPLSGEASEKGYALRRYRVSQSADVYMRISN